MVRPMMITAEKATRNSMTRLRLSVQHMSFLWTFCQDLVPSTSPTVWLPSRELVCPSGNPRPQPAGRQLLAGGIGVVDALEMFARPIGQLSQPLYGVESVG
jgi:hypothetical protein